MQITLICVPFRQLSPTLRQRHDKLIICEDRIYNCNKLSANIKDSAFKYFNNTNLCITYSEACDIFKINIDSLKKYMNLFYIRDHGTGYGLWMEDIIINSTNANSNMVSKASYTKLTWGVSTYWLSCVNVSIVENMSHKTLNISHNINTTKYDFTFKY